MRGYFNGLFKKGDKVDTIRDVAVRALYHIVEDYSDWYEEHGLYLPPDYAADPTRWTEDLHRIKRAFKLLYDELDGEGELYAAKTKWSKYGEVDAEEIKHLEKEINEGLEIFGKQLFYLTDPKKENK